jgi:2-polyprenyl-3-methyl-5-hydroxy-6-metoxy-1,4-benzoquinol methylase
VSRIIGIYADKNAEQNPFLDEFHLLDGDSWYVDSDSVDLIICDNVMDHIENPEQFFWRAAEC